MESASQTTESRHIELEREFLSQQIFEEASVPVYIVGFKVNVIDPLNFHLSSLPYCIKVICVFSYSSAQVLFL